MDQEIDQRLNFKIVAHELEAPYLEQGDNKVTAAHWFGAKIQPFNVDLKISGAQTEIFSGDRIIRSKVIIPAMGYLVRFACQFNAE